MSPSAKRNAISMVVLMLSIGYGAEATPLKDQTEATEATEARSGYSPPNYANSYAGYHGASYGGYQKQPHYGNQGIHLVLDATCKRYSCTPTTSPMAMCALVCSPDGRTPFCPILNCVSASGAACSDFKCSVQTVAQQPYY